MMRRALRTAALFLAATAVLLQGISWATIPSSDGDDTGQIHGCYSSRNGALRVIDKETTPPGACTKGEQEITWNQSGPQGPAGADGADGQDGADGTDAAALASIDDLAGLACSTPDGEGTVNVERGTRQDTVSAYRYALSLSCDVDKAPTTECDDGNFANGQETYDPETQTCVPGEPPNCDDGKYWTVDSADGQGCVHVLSDAACDDDVWANGSEKATAEGCVGGEPPCDDGDPITTDTADETTQTCTFVGDDSVCDDGLWANGAEWYDEETHQCRPGTPPVCDDGDPSTEDYADEETDSCQSRPLT